MQKIRTSMQVEVEDQSLVIRGEAGQACVWYLFEGLSPFFSELLPSSASSIRRTKQLPPLSFLLAGTLANQHLIKTWNSGSPRKTNLIFHHFIAVHLKAFGGWSYLWLDGRALA